MTTATVFAWLEDVSPGLGAYLHVFEKYGAVKLDDLEHLIEDEILLILAAIQLESKDVLAVLPLTLRKLGTVCRARGIAAGAAAAAATAAAATAAAAMFTPPHARPDRGGARSSCSNSAEESEVDSEDDDDRPAGSRRYRGGAATGSNSASHPFGSRAQTHQVCTKVCDMHLPSPYLPYVHPHIPSVTGVR